MNLGQSCPNDFVLGDHAAAAAAAATAAAGTAAVAAAAAAAAAAEMAPAVDWKDALDPARLSRNFGATMAAVRFSEAAGYLAAIAGVAPADGAETAPPAAVCVWLLKAVVAAAGCLHLVVRM